MQVEQPLVDELEGCDRGERLADRADLEQRVGSDRSARFELCEAVSTDENRAVAIGQSESQARYLPALHRDPSRVVDGLHASAIDHAAIVGGRPGLDLRFSAVDFGNSTNVDLLRKGEAALQFAQIAVTAEY